MQYHKFMTPDSFDIRTILFSLHNIVLQGCTICLKLKTKMLLQYATKYQICFHLVFMFLLTLCDLPGFIQDKTHIMQNKINSKN